MPDKLELALYKLRPRLVERGETPRQRVEKVMEAKEQVIAWALEAVGSDELITDEDLRAYPEDSTERWEKEARNQLRREIKAKLTGGKP